MRENSHGKETPETRRAFPARLTMTLVLAIATVIFAIPAWAGGLSGKSGAELAKIVKGGLLYDKWYSELDREAPKVTHPAYPKTSRYKGKSTWRCKECHGWDYRGRDGAYKKGKHFSGIPGIRGYNGRPPAGVVSILKDKNHLLGDKLPHSALEALAAFVTQGQMDMTRYISASKEVKGDAFKGGRIYAVTCARCHGPEGREINFGDKKKPKYMGTVANSNPWETLHKIRVGQPNEEMTSTLFLTEQQQVDVLKFTMGLPGK